MLTCGYPSVGRMRSPHWVQVVVMLAKIDKGNGLDSTSAIPFCYPGSRGALTLNNTILSRIHDIIGLVGFMQPRAIRDRVI